MKNNILADITNSAKNYLSIGALATASLVQTGCDIKSLDSFFAGVLRDQLSNREKTLEILSKDLRLSKVVSECRYKMHKCMQRGGCVSTLSSKMSDSELNRSFLSDKKRGDCITRCMKVEGKCIKNSVDNLNLE